MSTLSITPQERARKAFSRLLQVLGEPGRQVALAASLGTSESTISRLKTEKTEDVLALIYACGFKLVSQDKVCVDGSALEFMRATTARVLANEERARELWETGE